MSAPHAGRAVSGRPVFHRTPTSATPGQPGTQLGRRVVCPICRELITWVDDPHDVYEWVVGDNRYNRVDLSLETSPAKRNFRRSQCYVLCPAPQLDPLNQHYVPADYRVNGPPVIVGLVGRPSSGKTHLLVAMLAELLRGRGTPYGITEVTPLDRKQHVEFDREMIGPFLAGRRLAGTGSSVQRYAESVQVTTPTGTRTIVFFDIAGEDFRLLGSDERPSEFLLAVGAVLFVEDVEDVASAGNEWITDAMAVLQHVPDHRNLPTAVVLTKADQQRFVEPFDHWLREPPPQRPWSPRFHQESRDVYAWLHRNDATFMLSLVETFQRCTLHVASASGGAAEGESFPRGVRPTRVLEPLVSLLAMTGAFPDPDGDGTSG